VLALRQWAGEMLWPLGLMRQQCNSPGHQAIFQVACPGKRKMFSCPNCLDPNWVLYITTLNQKAHTFLLKSEGTQNITEENAAIKSP